MMGMRHFFLLLFIFVNIRNLIKNLITTRNSTHYKQFITALTSIYLKMKKLSCISSYIKQDVYNFLFNFFRLFCSHYSHSLRHPSLGLSTRLLTLRQTAQALLSRKIPFFRVLHLRMLISLYPALSLFETQYQLTHHSVMNSAFPFMKMPVFQGVASLHTKSFYTVKFLCATQYKLTHHPVRNSTLPFRKMPIFHGVVSWHTNYILTCVIFFWDSATAQRVWGA